MSAPTTTSTHSGTSAGVGIVQTQQVDGDVPPALHD
jgi:hypothetical protein